MWVIAMYHILVMYISEDFVGCMHSEGVDGQLHTEWLYLWVTVLNISEYI